MFAPSTAIRVACDTIPTVNEMCGFVADGLPRAEKASVPNDVQAAVELRLKSELPPRPPRQIPRTPSSNGNNRTIFIPIISKPLTITYSNTPRTSKCLSCHEPHQFCEQQLSPVPRLGSSPPPSYIETMLSRMLQSRLIGQCQIHL